ncbi:MAG: FxsA family protein [Armatimonadota bacterium]
MRLRLFPVLTALFVGLPLIDVVVLVFLGQYLTFWPTVASVLLSGVLGAWLAKQQGLSVWRGIQRDLSAGQVPAQGLIDAVFILIAGGMLMTPGFLTDIVGLALLLPPVRQPLKRYLRARLERAVTVRYIGPNLPGV